MRRGLGFAHVECIGSIGSAFAMRHRKVPYRSRGEALAYSFVIAP